MNSAQRTFAADQGVDPSLWRRVHVITPLLEIWHILVAGFALATYRNFSEIQEMLRSEYLLSFLSERFFYLVGSSLILIAVLVGFAFLQWWSLAFAVTETAVWSRRGILKRQQRHARLDRVQAVDITQPILGRLIGLGKIDVEVAGGADSNITIGYLKVSELEALRGEILARAAGLKMGQQSQAQASVMGIQGSAEPYSAPAGASSYASSESGYVPPQPYAPTQDPYASPQPGYVSSQPYAPAQPGYVPTSPSPMQTGPASAQPGYAPAPANYSYMGESIAPASIPVAPEREIYQVPMGRLLASQLLSVGSMLSILFLAVLIIGGLVATTFIGIAGIAASLGGFFAVGISIVSFQWNRFASEANFRLAVSPDGIRLRRGLLSTRAQTIPPRRIHAIQIQQPLLWRFLGWYRVLILQAGYGAKEKDADKQQSSHVLIPVGTRRDIDFALWAVIEDLGVDDVPAFIEAALAGTGTGHGFVQMSPRALILDPLLFRRRARAITRTTYVVRDGWLTRKSFWAPIARLQSATAKAGPLERALGVASLHMDMVPGPFGMKAEHQDATQVSEDLNTLIRLGHETRVSEPAEKWMMRMENGVRSGFETPLSRQ